MKVIMYSPWPNSSFVSHATEYVNGAKVRQHKQQGKHYEVRDRAQSLQDLVPGDRLYIMGHGIDCMDEIHADTDTPWQSRYEDEGYSTYRNGKDHEYPSLKPKQLIAKLHAVNLPGSLTDIRLWVCKGGDFDFTRFAIEFTALIKKSNPLAIVTAYSGYMLLLRSGRKKGDPILKNPGPASPAKTFKIVVNNADLFKKLEPLYQDTDDD